MCKEVQASDSSRVERLLTECANLLPEEPQKAIQTAQKVLRLADETDVRSIGLGHFFLGQAFYYRQSYDSAILTMQTAIPLLKEAQELHRLGLALNTKAVSEKNITDYAGALNSQLSSIDIFKSLNDTSRIIVGYNNLGILYNEQEKLTEAAAWFKKALQLAIQLNDEYLVVLSKSNAAMNLHSQEKFEAALRYFNEVLAYDLANENLGEIAASYNNVASCHLKLGNFSTAIDYLNRSIEYKKQEQDSYGLIISYANKAEALHELKKFNQERQYLDSALQLSQSLNVRKLEADVLLKYYHLFSALQQHDSALYYYKLFHEVNDSLLNIDKELALANIKRKFDLERIDQELAQKKIEVKAYEEVQMLYMVGFLSLIVMFVFFGFSFFRIKNLNKRLQEKQIEQTKTNEILSRVNEQLITARDQAEAANKAKSAFLSNVSHEIRTPLNAILGLLEILRADFANTAQKSTIDTVQHAANSLLHIINDLLDLSKIEAGKISFEQRRFSIKNLIQQVEKTLYSLKQEKPVDIHVSLAPALPEFLIGDEFRLNQILLNLGGNAVKFTDSGSITLRVEILEHQEQKIHLKFFITDTGIGIAPEHQAGIFNRFSQAAEHTARKFGGTGLGLAICKKLIELQEGEIGVESAFGAGATFWFTLKLTVASQQRNIDAISESDQSALLDQKHALIVDDNLLNLKLASKILGKWNITSKTVQSGADAISLVQSGETFDFVLLDIHMPEMNGFETIQQLKPIIGKNCPVYALTADTYEETTQSIHDLGFTGMLHKPYTALELKTLLLSNME